MSRTRRKTARSALSRVVLTGLVSGTARAVITWLIEHITS